MYFQATITAPADRPMKSEHGTRLQEVLYNLANEIVEHPEVEEWLVVVKVTH